jgi:HAE1 family hydrophobic/amphiphilic exporter-1
MKIWETAVRKPVFAWMIMLFFVVFGIFSYKKLGISLMPDQDMPMVNIALTWDGASPEVMEMDVVDIVESQLSSLAGIENMTSTSRKATANISLEFNVSKNIDTAVQEVQTKLLQAQRLLPKDMDPPIISKVNQEDRPFLWLSVTSTTMPKRELMIFVRDQLKEKFQTIDGVADVQLSGFIQPNIRIYPLMDQLKKYDLTPLDLSNAIKSEHLELPAGVYKTGEKDLVVRMLGEAKSAEELKGISISKRGGSPNFTPLTLGEMSTIEEGLADTERLSRSSGVMSLGLGILKQRGANTVLVGNKVMAKMKSLQKTLPSHIKLNVNYDQTTFIRESTSELAFTIFLSILVTALVVWFFLGSFNATLNIILSIPTVLLGTLFIIQQLGYTLNLMTMLALTLVVGMIVDDNIMVLENINRWYEKLKNWKLASIKGTDEIAGAVIATTLAVIAIFLPLALINGKMLSYFHQFAVTIAVAIALSCLDSLILTPMRAAFLSSSKSHTTSWGDKLIAPMSIYYERSLKTALNAKWKTLGIGVISFLLLFSLSKVLKKEMAPGADQSTLMIRIETDPGSSLEYTNNVALKLESIFAQMSQVKRYFMMVGGFAGNEANTAFTFITLKPVKERGELPGISSHNPSQNQIADYLRSEIKKQIKGAFLVVMEPNSLGIPGGGRSGGANVEFSLVGKEWDQIAEQVIKAKKIMEESGLLDDVNSNFKGLVPEMQITPNRKKSLARGISVEDIAKTIQATVSGTVVAKISSGGRRFDVRLKLTDEDLKNQSVIANLPIRNNRGQNVSLSDVAEIKNGFGLFSSLRENRERSISLSGQSKTGLSPAVVTETIKEKLQKAIPSEFPISLAGDAKELEKTNSDSLFVFLLGLLVSYMVLGAQYNSFRSPFIILMAVPFSIAGGFLGLWITGQSINIFSAIGFILLAGIVKKNSIMLVEFTEHLKVEEKLKPIEALLKACPLRLKPIIMTTLTTIIGTLPAALALGPGSETRIPLAVTVIGGLVISTLLTLYIIPCLYLVMHYKWEHHEKN